LLLFLKVFTNIIFILSNVCPASSNWIRPLQPEEIGFLFPFMSEISETGREQSTSQISLLEHMKFCVA